MKRRNFYPAQVLTRMTGKAYDTLDATSRHALDRAFRRSRKTRLQMAIVAGSVLVHRPGDPAHLAAVWPAAVRELNAAVALAGADPRRALVTDEFWKISQPWLSLS